MGTVLEKKRYSLFFLMRRDHPFSTLLIFGISLLLTFSFAYACCDDLLEADFLSTGAKYETQDADEFLLEKQNPAKAAGKPLPAFLLFTGNSLAFSPVFSIPPRVTDPTLSALRC